MTKQINKKGFMKKLTLKQILSNLKENGIYESPNENKIATSQYMKKYYKDNDYSLFAYWIIADDNTEFAIDEQLITTYIR